EFRRLALEPEVAGEHEAGGRDEHDDDGDDPSGKEKSPGGGYAEVFRIVFFLGHMRLLCVRQVDCFDLGVALFFSDHVAAEDRIDSRYDEQRHHCGSYQPADHSTPQRSILLGTRTERKRHREHPENHRERGHDDRAEADATGLDGCGERTIAFFAQLVGEGDQQVAVGDADADRHNRAHKRFDVDGRACYREHPEHAGERARDRHHDDERLEPRLKVRDHQQVHEDDGENQALAKGAERIAHRLALAADDDVSAGGQWAEVVDLALYGGGDAAEVAALHGGVNVDDALHRVMRDDGGI